MLILHSCQKDLEKEVLFPKISSKAALEDDPFLVDRYREAIDRISGPVIFAPMHQDKLEEILDKNCGGAICIADYIYPILPDDLLYNLQPVPNTSTLLAMRSKEASYCCGVRETTDWIIEQPIIFEADKQFYIDAANWYRTKEVPRLIRPVTITVSGTPDGFQYINSYPWKYTKGTVKFEVPLYKVTVDGTVAAGSPVNYYFKALRFGVHKDSETGPETVVGKANYDSRVVMEWMPDNPHYPDGAFWVYDNYLIHIGPSDLSTCDDGNLGCIAVLDTYGLDYTKFKKSILELSGSKDYNEIIRAGKLKIIYEKSLHPPLKRIDPK
ncbi:MULTISPECIES: hypothetical protein [unclassified Sphingobacterium]|uniref:hypothetical protein n=1 Tax=unclassified Sphingobacterium TaxID=2609468 RepID=UPI0010486941|nr:MULTISPECIES: hypothetical protein [unclassified Sphingobacterium]MCS3556184.1 hypothetical protein [Sphingobacterium sp. JUb21]